VRSSTRSPARPLAAAEVVIASILPLEETGCQRTSGHKQGLLVVESFW
jgi:hypothetical protein